MSTYYQLDFERRVREIEKEIEELSRRPLGVTPATIDIGEVPPGASVDDLKKQRDTMLGEIYAELSPWDIVRVARHPSRPQGRDYIDKICRDFCEVHGDRRFGDDPALVTGFGRIGPHKCMIIAHHKGRTTQEKIACHFGCAHPEGYRKALLKMKLAAKFRVPIVTFVDTPGAYPGLGAEQRGQAEAIAVNMLEMSRLKTPIVSVVIGEGGSGGALGIAVADRVAMMRYAWYSVISPEGCAAILWKQANEQTNEAAARSLRLTARDNLEFGIVDGVVDEPLGGAHRDPDLAARFLMAWVVEQLDTLVRVPTDELLQRRYERFRKLGAFLERTGDEPQSEGTGETPVNVDAEASPTQSGAVGS